MRLVIHAGTHKTASTYFQHLLAANQSLLAGHGIYTRPDARMTGNHGTAWMTLVEDYRHIAAHVREALRLGRTAMLLSSEDFETLIFDHRRALLVETAAREAGATSIEWTFCFRSPGEYFTSLMAELSHTGFVDYLGALTSVLRDGRLRLFREAKRHPLYWDFCFDYETHLGLFGVAVSGQVTVHDFRDNEPFPGHGIIAALGVDPTSLSKPEGRARNARLAPEKAEEKRLAGLQRILEAAEVREGAIAAFSEVARTPAALQSEAEAAIDRLYQPGWTRLLAAR